MSDFLESVEGKIKQHGHAVISVGPDEQAGQLGFSYTVGLTPIAGCELLIEGMPPAQALTILNGIAKVVKTKGKLEPMVMVGALQNDYPVGIIETDAQARPGRINVVESLFPEIEHGCVLQVVLPDVERRLPWDEGYSLSGAQMLVSDPDSEEALQGFRSLPVENVEAIVRGPEPDQSLH